MQTSGLPSLVGLLLVARAAAACLAPAVVSDLASAGALAECETVGSVQITGPGSDFLHLLAFEVAQELVVQNTTGLTSLAGLRVVNITGDLVVQDNLQLTTLQGLEQLERVGAKLVVTRNDRLTTLSAVAHSLVFVGGSVQVSDNAALCQDLTSYKDFSWSAVVVEGGSIDVTTASVCDLPLTIMVATLGSATALCVAFCLFKDWRARKNNTSTFTKGGEDDGSSKPLLANEAIN